MISGNDFILINEVNESHLCGICYELAINPTECGKCENLYCNACALDWQKKNDSCPNKCQGNFELKPAHRLIRAEISKMKCKCKNSQYGCEEIITLEQLLNHLQLCKFVPTKCVDQCQWKGVANALKAHQEECQFILDFICNQCKQKVLKSQKDTHNCFETIMNMFQNLQAQFQDYKQQSEIKIDQLQKAVENQSRIQSEIVQQSMIFLQHQPQQQQQQQQVQQQEQKVQQSYIDIGQQIEPIKKISLQQFKTQQKLEAYQTQGKLGNVSSVRMCKVKHYLRFWTTPGIDASRQYCSKCLKKQICRYVCEQCKEYFCLICAPPENMCKGKSHPTQCPSGHKLISRNNTNYICDVCSQSGDYMPNSRTLCCQECDFDICQTCQENMMKNKDCLIF